jgi:hypothetical protein
LVAAGHAVTRLLIAGMAHIMALEQLKMIVSRCDAAVRMKRVLNGENLPDRER